jgi:hypothetical protein
MIDEVKDLIGKARALLRVLDNNRGSMDWQPYANQLETAVNKLEGKVGSWPDVTRAATELSAYLQRENWSQTEIFSLRQNLSDALRMSKIPDPATSEDVANALAMNAATEKRLTAETDRAEKMRELLEWWANRSSMIAYEGPEWLRMFDLTVQITDERFARRLTMEEMVELPRDGWIQPVDRRTHWKYDRAWSVDEKTFAMMRRAGMIGMVWNGLFVVCNG